MSLHAHFSADYATARPNSLPLPAAAGATLTEIDHPLNGRLGEKLAVDLAWLGPADARSVLVTVSGTHGVEGHYGSGCQVGWLTDAGGGALPDGVAHLLIHASNPHGFSWTRRTNEDNMDINRNFLDFTQPLPVNAGYAEVHRLIARKDWNDAVETRDGAIPRAPMSPVSGSASRRRRSAPASTAIPTASSMAAPRPAGRIARCAKSAGATSRTPGAFACSTCIPAWGRSAIRR